MPILVVLQALVDVRVAPPKHAVHQDRELVSHGDNGFGGAKFAAEAAVLGAEVTLAAEQGRGGDPEGRGRAIDDRTGASTDHLSPCDAIVGTQPKPRGEVVLVPPARHVEPDLADEGLCDADVDAVDPGEIDAADAGEFAAQVELWGMAARLPPALGPGAPSRGRRHGGLVTRGELVGRLVGEAFQMILERPIAFGDAVLVCVGQRDFLQEDKYEVGLPGAFEALGDRLAGGVNPRMA